MAIAFGALSKHALSAQIADRLRAAILAGDLGADQRLPGEAELAERFDVSRPTVREALKRLAAQNLIRTRRGPTGGSFVNRLGWEEAREAMVTNARLIVGMNSIDPRDVLEARTALEAACLPMVCARRTDADLARLRAEIARQRDAALSDEDFCASDVAFHRAVVESSGNPMLSLQTAGAIEATAPLLNMITFRGRERERIADRHAEMAAAIAARDDASATIALTALSTYALSLIEAAQRRREAKGAQDEGAQDEALRDQGARDQGARDQGARDERAKRDGLGSEGADAPDLKTKGVERRDASAQGAETESAETESAETENADANDAAATFAPEAGGRA